MKPKGIKWDDVDWTQSNHDLALQYGVRTRTVAKARERRGLPNPRFGHGKGDPNAADREVWKLSPANKPIRDLDYEFACDIRKDGRRKANSSFRRAVIDMFGSECSNCGYHKPPVKPHVHHIVSLGEGGKNCIRNGIVLCSRCHDEVHAGLLSLT